MLRSNKISLNIFDNSDLCFSENVLDTVLQLYYTIEFNKSNIEHPILFIQLASHITGSYSTGGSFDPPMQVTIIYKIRSVFSVYFC